MSDDIDDDTLRELNEIVAAAEAAEKAQSNHERSDDIGEYDEENAKETHEFAENAENATREPLIHVGEDGIRYEYDYQRGAWFPMVDEDIVAQQQQQYVYVPEQRSAVVKFDEKGVEEATEEKGQKKRNRGEVGWQAFDPSKNSNIYVTNLPEDTNIDEVHEYFKKVGIIKKDIETGEPKIKLYKDKDSGKLKGDGLVTYFSPASVDLAISILDETDFRPGCVVKVSKAVFQPKADFDPSQLKRKKKKKPKFDQTKQLAWGLAPEHAEIKKRNVVLKNLFDPREFQDDESLIREIHEDIERECGRIGPVERFDMYKDNPEGVIFVRYKMGEHAEKCIEVMNGRYYGGRKTSADFWDGKTKYDKAAPSKTDEERLEEFAKWLEEEGPK
eukprot:TRINITY_DN1667_c0_g1_i1.p1 TRINITY_DN1667_c0_g1~~TRINITY_DN1667_c0_g1_i1.p1  ORF type:complete len:387 (-),score=117.17 TRINITY_DN1667_c0_g1_i1:175-1335(-)